MPAIETRTIGTTVIGILPIAEGAPQTRRQREREAVGQLVRVLLDGAELSHDEHGAPQVDGYNISVTHSRQIAAIAFDREHRIGIDAEEWRAALLRVQYKFVRSSEAEDLCPERLLALWTIKEAVFKAAGNPRLTIADVECAPGLNRACADGRNFDIKSFWAGDTLVTLATED